ncbi:MAG: tRNA pseudouridine(13) synthase TruD [Candidatus Firestonebacteria bacterium]|nr:tRNA pseudouridine(13) synthase TruD [Candidatus Firestonebacteria bacterium]
MVKPKIKCRPEDFVVREQASLPIKKQGEFGVYVLEKRGWNTVDALREIAKSLHLKPADVAYGGKKDRYGLTRQWITLRHSRVQTLHKPNFHLEFVGFADQPMAPAFIESNHFEIVIRKLTPDEAQKALENLPAMEKNGIPNYFDDQRFGSYDPEQGFWVEQALKKHFNGALKTYLTAVHPEDKPEVKTRKRTFGAQWRQWRTCRDLAVTDFEKAAFGFLLQKSDGFLSVLFTIPREDCSMAISAFQSHLWNETLRRYLESRKFSAWLSYPGTAGAYRFYAGLSVKDRAEMTHKRFPTAAGKMLWEDQTAQKIYLDLLGTLGLHPGLFGRFPLRQAFFKSTPRPVLVFPQALCARRGEDELYPGKTKIELAFTLPRGSYATLLVKRLFAEPLRPREKTQL